MLLDFKLDKWYMARNQARYLAKTKFFWLYRVSKKVSDRIQEVAWSVSAGANHYFSHKVCMNIEKIMIWPGSWLVKQALEFYWELFFGHSLHTCTKSRKASREMTSHLWSCCERLAILKKVLVVPLNIIPLIKSWMFLIFSLIWCQTHLGIRRFWKKIAHYDIIRGKQCLYCCLFFWLMGPNGVQVIR